jgi:hypothetical protein
VATQEHVGGTGGTEAIRRSEKLIGGSSFVELVTGAGAIVLPILGLIGVLPLTFAALAFIAIGAAMMFQGGTLAAQTRTLLTGVDEGKTAGLGFIGATNAEITGGAAVIALGILALLRVAPRPLLGVAAMVAGGAMVFGAGAAARLGSFRYGAAELSSSQREVLREAVRAAAGADILVGLGSLVLGILAVAGVGSAATVLTLLLVASLALGGGLFLTGTTTGARMTALLRH